MTNIYHHVIILIPKNEKHIDYAPINSMAHNLNASKIN
jgi:hypothetical protein